MATRTISTRLAIEGEAEYRAALKNINAELSLHKSELEKVSAQYNNNANSLEALQAKEAALKGVLTDLGQKHSEHTTMLEKAKQAQGQYAEQVAKLKAQLAELKTTTGASAEEEEKLTKELAAAEKSMQEAKNSATYYQKQLNYTERDQAKFNTELDKTESYLDEARTSAGHCATSIDQYGKEVKQAGEKSEEFGDKSKDAVGALASALAAAGVVAALKEVVQTIQECVKASTDFESAITGVFKTVEGTPEQLAAVSEGIRAMSLEIPSTTTEIAAVAEAAGQLGIATDDVLSFTRTMLDLGQSTNLSAEEAASALAKFANITGTAAEDYGRLGSVIVGLGNNFATTEADIVSMATRLASTGALTGLSEANIMALATALSSVGIEAEAGGSAISKLLKQFEVMVATGSPKLADFARVAGMSADEFSQAWGQDAVEALSAFIAGLGSVDTAGGSSVAVLDELGITETRMSNAVLALASSGDLLTQSVSMANSAWEENTALADEANKRYATTESKMAMLENSVTGVKAAIGDALTPALGELAEAGTEAFSWAADFIKENPWLVQVITGVTAALGVLTAGVVVVNTVVPIATKVFQAFQAVLASIAGAPLLIVSAIIGVTTALATLIPMVQEATKETGKLSAAAREAKGTFEETARATQEQSDSILSMVSALEAAVDQEDKTAAQKAAVLDMVEQLNEAVPNLSLAYDDQTDSLNMTTEAIRAMVLAEKERAEQEAQITYLTALYKDYQELLEKQAAAKDAVAEAEANLEEQTGKSNRMVEAAQGALSAAQIILERYNTELEANLEETARAEQAYNDLTEETDAVAGAMGGLGQAATVTAEQIAELTDAGDELAEQSQTLTGATDALTDALKEQRESGSLSLDTTLDLIDAGYSAALSIDNETGAITLNKDAYISIAQAKIEAQIQTLETQRQSAVSKALMLEEAQAAIDAAVGYTNKAKAELMAERAASSTLNAINGEVSAYDAQIAALKKAQDAIGSYSYSATSAARSVSSSAKKAKTQAEKDMEAYKEQKAELDHLRAVDEVDDEAYYTRLAGLRDDYLTDDSNLTEYRKVTEQIFKYDEELAEAEEKLHEKQLDEYGDYLDGQFNLYDDQMKAYLAEQTAMIKELEDNYKAVMKEQQAMAAKLADYGDLFTLDDKGKVNLEDLEEQTKAIREYGKMLEDLKKKGISDGLLNEIISMGVDDASAYGAELLEMSGDQLKEYSALWEEKNLEAARIAEQFYKDQLSTIQTQYEGQLQDALSGLQEIGADAGMNTVQGLIDGMDEKREEFLAAIREMLEAGENTIKTTWDIHSPSKVMAKLGGYAAQGLAVGFEDEIAKVQELIARSVPTSFDLSDPSAAQRDQTAALVNAVIGQQNTRQSWDDLPPIHLEATFEMDSEVVAQKTFVYNAREAKMHGRSMVEKGL